MSQGLVELRRLLFQGTGKVTALVSAINDTELTVSTPTGIKKIENQTATQFLVGDSVVIDGNTLIGKVSSEQAIPVYFV